MVYPSINVFSYSFSELFLYTTIYLQFWSINIIVATIRYYVCVCLIVHIWLFKYCFMWLYVRQDIYLSVYRLIYSFVHLICLLVYLLIIGMVSLNNLFSCRMIHAFMHLSFWRCIYQRNHYNCQYDHSYHGCHYYQWSVTSMSIITSLRLLLFLLQRLLLFFLMGVVSTPCRCVWLTL